ncbi:hypothetical protein AMTRI_Chr11g99990 [Amborella trichopoda]
MKLQIWNVRGLGQSSKKDGVKDLTSKLSPTVLALLETKPPERSLQLIRYVWGRRPCQWVSLPANGASGGIWVVWDPSDHTLNSSFIGEFLVTLLLSCISDGVPWKFSAVMAQTHPPSRTRLWAELEHRNSSTSISQDMRDFSDFISRNELLDIPLQGCRYTWSNHTTKPTLSKLDRFLLSVNWEECFPRSLSMVLPKPTSDHYPIMLDTIAVKWGLRPFKFELHWLQEESLHTLVQTWWNCFSSQVTGRAGSFRPKSNSSNPLSKLGVVPSSVTSPISSLPC